MQVTSHFPWVCEQRERREAGGRAAFGFRLSAVATPQRHFSPEDWLLCPYGLFLGIWQAH